MSKSKINFILVAVLFLGCTLNTFAQTVPPADSEGKLLAVLTSDAPQKAKIDALRQLSFIATKDAVPVLATLLADEKLAHMARYAMEPIPDYSVDIAFRKALGELKGPQLVGLIGSIGVRGRSRGILEPLKELLDDRDPLVAQAAARALGSIRRTASLSAAVMLEALSDAPAAKKAALYEGIFRCAESLTAGKPDEAVKIYDAIIALEAPHQIRAGALRGKILASGEEGYKTIEKYLQNKDYIMFSAAVQTALESPYSNAVEVLADQLENLSGDNKILVIQTLGNRADPCATPALTAAAKSGSKDARIAAIHSLAQIGDATTVKNLASLLDDKDSDVADAALMALASSPDKAADKAILDMLENNDADIQLKAIDLIGRRRIANVTGALLKATGDNDESVRTASIILLGDLADAKDFPLLLELLLKASGREEIRAAERAISNIAVREAKLSSGKVKIIKAIYGAVSGEPSADVTSKIAEMVKAGNASVQASNANFGDPASGIVKQLKVDFSVNGVSQSVTVPENGTAEIAVAIVPDELIEQLSSATKKASTQQKLALLRILRTTNSPKALEAIQTATKDKDTEIAQEAISLLCSWSTPEALGHIMPLTKSADLKTQILALRGALRLIPLQNVSDDNKLAAFTQIVSLTKRDEEKKLLVGALAKVPSAGSLAMVIPYLNDNSTKQEAAMAAVTIAEKIASEKNAQVGDAMNKVIKATNNKEVTDRAKAVLAKAK